MHLGSRLSFVCSVIALLLIGLPAAAQWQSDYYSGHTEVEARTVRVSMSGVDDIGAVFVLNPVSLRRLERAGTLGPNYECRWSNADGRGSWNLADDLYEGENLIVLALYNLVYTGVSLRSSGGKYSYDFRLEAGGRTLHSASRVVNNNSRGLKYLFFVKATRTGDTVVLEGLTQEERLVAVDIEVAIDWSFGGEGRVDVDWEPIIRELAR